MTETDRQVAEKEIAVESTQAKQVQDSLQALFGKMLKEYPEGLSSTSTKKFDDIKKLFADLLEIHPSEVYSVGAGTRPTNLEVRLTQGVQATKHTVLGLGFLQAYDLKQAEKIAESALVTSAKFLGRKKATYDAVGIIVEVGGTLHFLKILELAASEIGKKLKLYFPGLEIKTLDSSQAALDRQTTLFSPEALEMDEYERNLLLKVITLLEDGFAGVIFTGPPGTSKSYYASRIAAQICENNSDRVRFIQFHPSYQYEDFVEGFVPTDGGYFLLKDKHLLDMCKIARESEGFSVLVIDELSRSDPARIFGEALTYVEMSKRDQLFYLASGKEVSIPKNLIFLATMNQMDRGVDEVDAALERRFAKIAMEPDIKILEKLLTDNGMEEELKKRVLNFFFHLSKDKNSSCHIGHAYFHRISDAEGLQRLWESQLQFYFKRAFPIDDNGYQEISRNWQRIFAPSENQVKES